MWILPVWARLMTSYQLGIEPQNGEATEHSCGRAEEVDGQGRLTDTDDGEMAEDSRHLRRHRERRIDRD